MHLSVPALILALSVTFLVAAVLGLGTALLVIRIQGLTRAILAGFASAGVTLMLGLAVLTTISQLR